MKYARTLLAIPFAAVLLWMLTLSCADTGPGQSQPQGDRDSTTETQAERPAETEIPLERVLQPKSLVGGGNMMRVFIEFQEPALESLVGTLRLTPGAPAGREQGNRPVV